MHVFTSFVLFEGEKFHGGGRVWYFNVIWLKSIHTFTFIVTVFTASALIRVSARNASLYIAVMIFCAQPYLKPCFVCPFYILSTCPSKGLCTALVRSERTPRHRAARETEERLLQGVCAKLLKKCGCWTLSPGKVWVLKHPHPSRVRGSMCDV